MTESCRQCGTILAGAHCHACGQKRFVDADRRLGHLLGQFLEAFTSLDSRFWRSMRALVLQPGRLSAEYLAGRRQTYMPPITVFLLVNLLFFLAPPMTDFDLPFIDQVSGELALRAHPQLDELSDEARARIRQLGGQAHSPWTTPWVERRIAEKQGESPELTVRDYAERYQASSSNISKLLIILHVPLLAAALALILFRQRRYYAEHFVVSLHLMAFAMLLMIAMGLILNIEVFAARAQLAIALGLPLLACTYLALAFRRVFELRWWQAAVVALVWMVALLLINVFPYRAVQFVLANLLM
jgi:hypothetical protein